MESSKVNKRLSEKSYSEKVTSKKISKGKFYAILSLGKCFVNKALNTLQCRP